MNIRKPIYALSVFFSVNSLLGMHSNIHKEKGTQVKVNFGDIAQDTSDAISRLEALKNTHLNSLREPAVHSVRNNTSITAQVVSPNEADDALPS